MSIPISSGLLPTTEDDAENDDSDGDDAALVDKHLAELALDAPLQELAVTDADILMLVSDHYDSRWYRFVHMC